MGKFLFKIQETFQLQVIGLTVSVDIKTKDATINAGDEIELRLAENFQLITKVESIPMLKPYNPERPFSFSLPKDINKEDVPIGTEVWSHP
jgi:hypothetical protein